MLPMQTLPDFIRAVGVDNAARLFGESPRAVKGWMYRERIPRKETSNKIVERSRKHPKGPVTFEGIYGRD